MIFAYVWIRIFFFAGPISSSKRDAVCGLQGPIVYIAIRRFIYNPHRLLLLNACR